jgi:hypothetical protein
MENLAVSPSIGSIPTGKVERIQIYTLNCVSYDGNISTATFSIAPAKLFVCPEGISIDTESDSVQMHAWYKENPSPGLDCISVPDSAGAREVTYLSSCLWRSSAPSIASISSSGLVNPSNEGLTTIFATYTDEFEITGSTTVGVTNPMVQCWRCNETDYSCDEPPSERRNNCLAGEFYSPDTCDIKCVDKNWKETNP